MRVGAMEFCVNELKKSGHLNRILRLNSEDVAKRMGTCGSNVIHWKLAGKIDTPHQRKKFAQIYGWDFNSGVRY